ncbi:MAG: hypothetical protein ABL878_20715, partial [Burkholderiales bacterium]
MMKFPRGQVLPVAIFGAVYALLTALVENSYTQLIMTVVPIWAVMGLSWNLLSGYSGLVSFGHAAFFGLGAYFVALAQIHWGLSPWFGIPCAAAVGALAGLAVGIPTFRLRTNVVHYAAFTNHISLYPAPFGVPEFEADIATYGAGKGTLRFPNDAPLPLDLI